MLANIGYKMADIRAVAKKPTIRVCRKILSISPQFNLFGDSSLEALFSSHIKKMMQNTMYIKIKNLRYMITICFKLN